MAKQTTKPAAGATIQVPISALMLPEGVDLESAALVGDRLVFTIGGTQSYGGRDYQTRSQDGQAATYVRYSVLQTPKEG